MVSNNKYLFSAYGDGTNIYIYRMDKNGTILRAKHNATEYNYVDVSDIPRRVIKEFTENYNRCWVEPDPIVEQSLSWNIQENDADTGISDEEFVNLIIEKCPGSRFNSEKHCFEILAKLGDGSRKYIRFPNSRLKYMANRNRYFGNASFMV
jgi:hypothetical protein